MRGACSSVPRSGPSLHFIEMRLAQRPSCVYNGSRKRRNDAADRPQGHLATLARHADPAEWRQTELDVLEQIVKEVRCYAVKFDQRGAIVNELVNLVKAEG
jgi:hypothetical protein